MGFIGIRWDSVEWTNMAQDMQNWEAYVKTLLNLNKIVHSVYFVGQCT